MKDSPTAANLLALLCEALDCAGLSKDVLRAKLVSCGFDGAAVMQGEHSGVGARLQQDFPFATSVWCQAHRL
eukprot:317544-Chlamydomonas_euryale.AAC.1